MHGETWVSKCMFKLQQVIYVIRNNGGRGLLNIHHLHNRSIVTLVGYIFNGNSVHAKVIKKFWMNKSSGTLMKKAEDIVEESGLNIMYAEDGIKKDGELMNHQKLGYLLKKEYQKTYSTWLSTVLHGKIIQN